MAGKRKMGKVDTNTLLIVGAIGVVALYLFTRTTATVTPAGTLLTQGGGSTLIPTNPIAQDISAGGQATSSILTAISNF